MDIPDNLEELAQKNEVDFDVLLQLVCEPNNVTLFRCQKCYNPRPYFAIYDVRTIDATPEDWVCESCMTTMKRLADAIESGAQIIT